MVKSSLNKKTGSVLGTTIAFVVLGTAFIIIGFHSSLLHWMQKWGITVLALSVIPAMYLVHELLLKKIKEM